METLKTIGFPSMHVEPGERRAFLPEFVGTLERAGFGIVLEHGYGSGTGLLEPDYLDQAPQAVFVSHSEAYQQDFVLVLRCPSQAELERLSPGSCLISMLHYPTNQHRTEFIRSLGVRAISLDSIADDDGKRLVENMRSVAWNGLEVAYSALVKDYPPPGFFSPRRPPIQVTIMGSGAVGIQAVQAAIRYADDKRWQEMAGAGVPGVLVRVIDYDTTAHADIMGEVLSSTDILVDATQRPDPGKPIIPNHWIEVMPRHAVLLDLCVDPYSGSDPPLTVKGIEGLPHGNLDQYLFAPDDSNWDKTVPRSIPSTHRRTAATCYSWPGIHPKACMEHYGKQLTPLMKTLINFGYEGLSESGDYYQRALYRATLEAN